MNRYRSHQWIACSALPALALSGLSASPCHASATGADSCQDVTVVPITPGLFGSPSITVLNGSLTGATGPDCAAAPDTDVVLWWEAFELTECAHVTIYLCGTSSIHLPTRGYVYDNCPTESLDCGVRHNAETQSRAFCEDGNHWLSIVALAPGIYYYPIVADPAVLEEPVTDYQLTIAAEQCGGACCDRSTGVCTDSVLASECGGPDQEYSDRDVCSSRDCVRVGEEYDRLGVELLSNMPFSAFEGTVTRGNDVWGYTSPSGHEYAIMGFLEMTAFVEVTDPFNPVLVGQIPGPRCTWRDIKTLGHYAYIVNQCDDGMPIVDLSEIDSGTLRLVDRFTGSGFIGAHNVFIDTTSGYLYWVASNLGGGGLVAVDLADRENPVVVGAWPDRYTHDTYVTTYTSGPYAGREVAFNSTPGYGLTIVDVTNKANMFELSTQAYPYLAYAHQGWLTPDKRFFLFGDEFDEMDFGLSTTTYVVDVQDLANPQLVDTFSNEQRSIDHNLVIREGFTYLASYTNGLRVYDSSDPLNMNEVAYFDTHPEKNDLAIDGAWGAYADLPSGIVLISDQERGLFVLNYDCNDNGIDDTIDIANLTSDDDNGNGLPDECEQCASVPPPALVEGDHARSRYLSIAPSGSGLDVAIRVTLANIDGFPAANGRTLWVGPPQQFPEENTAQPELTFTGAALRCEPHYQDWSSIDVLRVYGGEIIPNSSYKIESVHVQCPQSLGRRAGAGAPLEMTTGLWGDVAALFDDPANPPQPDFNDIAGLVLKFQAEPTAPIKAGAQLQPNTVIPERVIDFKDIAAGVAAFVSTAYADMGGITGPCACPSSVTCEATACTNDLQCEGGYCIGGFCTDACGRCTP